MMNRLLKLWAIPSPKWRQGFAAPATTTAIATYAVSAPSVEGETEKTAFLREGPGISYGLNSALARKGVIVQEKAFLNLTPSELQQKGATTAEPLLGLPVYVRGNFLGGSSEISKAQFSYLLKQELPGLAYWVSVILAVLRSCMEWMEKPAKSESTGLCFLIVVKKVVSSFLMCFLFRSFLGIPIPNARRDWRPVLHL